LAAAQALPFAFKITSPKTGMNAKRKAAGFTSYAKALSQYHSGKEARGKTRTI
jgi:hypothetical protein